MDFAVKRKQHEFICPPQFAKLNLAAMHRLKFIAIVLALFVPLVAGGQTKTNLITREAVLQAQLLLDLGFSDAKVDLMLPGLREQLLHFLALRKFPLSNSVPPALLFNPIPVGAKFDHERRKFKMTPAGHVRLPANPDDLAFYSVSQLAALVKTRQITSESLTRFYLERLKKFGPKLECVVTLTEDLALTQR